MNINLKIISIPDHKSQLLVAKLIVARDHTVSMHRAMEMVAKPPVVLRGMSVLESKEHIAHLKAYGVAFKIVQAEDAPRAAPNGRADNRWGQDGAAQSSASTMSIDFSKARMMADPDEFDRAVRELLDLAAADTAGDGSPPINAPSPKNDPPKDIRQPPTVDHRPSRQTMPPQGPPITGSARKRKTRRIGHIDANAIEELERESRKKAMTIVLIVVGAFLLIGVIAHILPTGGGKQRSQGSQQAAPAVDGKAAQSQQTARQQKNTGAQEGKTADRGKTAGDAATAQSGADTAQTEPPPEPGAASREQTQQANTYVDSAKAVDGDLKKQIAFYKLAISFNRRNLPAWQGLLQAYLEGGMMREAGQTEREIVAIFGPEVMSISSVIKNSFGELTNARATRDGTYRVDYISRKTNKNEILRDIFEMTRSVRGACNCRDITIHASTGAGKGVIARVGESASAHSFSDFSRQAEITWLD